MPSDLTERLAAKLAKTIYPPRNWEVAPERVPFDTLASVAHQILPLLLSEPELVASLSDEVRVKALESLLNSAPVMESAFVDAAEVLALAPEELRLSVLTPRERAVMKLGEATVTERDAFAKWDRSEMDGPEYDAWFLTHAAQTEALIEVQALTPEGKDATA